MFGNVVVFEARRMVRNFPPLFFALAFPVMVLGLFGTIYGNEPSDQFGGLGTVDVSVPAYIALVLSVVGLMSFPLGMVEYRSRGFLRRLRATPARPGAFLGAQAVVNAVVFLVGIAILIAVGALAFDLSAPAHPAAFVGLIVLAGASTCGIGLLIAALARSESSATAIANLVYFPMIFLTGATIPLEIMPSGLRTASDFLPVTHAVKALKWAWLDRGGGAMPVSLAVLAGTTVICAALAARLFRWE